MADSPAVRPQGLAGAYVSLADDEASAQVNPAGLARLKGLSLGGSQMLGLLGAQLSHLHLAGRVSDSAGFSGHLSYFHDNDSFRDAFGQESGSFSNTNWLAGAALGFRLLPAWRAGLGLKVLGENYAGASSNSLAGDLGLQGPVFGRVRFGVALQNLGVQLSSASGASHSLPLRVQGGFSIPVFISPWRLGAELQALPGEGLARALIGSELKLDAGSAEAPMAVALRAGLATPLGDLDSTRAALGAGLELGSSYALDYALVSVGDLGAAHRMSLELRFKGGSLSRPALPGAELQAVYGLEAAQTLDGIELSWKDANEKVEGYHIYADFGIYVERVNIKPVAKPRQKFTNVEKGRSYRFFVRPLGSDGLEGPASEVMVYKLP